MDRDGGKSEFANNKAGAPYGTGYCDSQCPQDIKFINGKVSALASITFIQHLTSLFTGQHRRLDAQYRELEHRYRQYRLMLQ